MRTFIVVLMLALFMVSVTGSVAEAAIHPIVASFCAKVAATNPNVLDPPGQTPPSFNPATWDQSDLRALLATGFLTLIRDASGNVIGIAFDPTLPMVKDGSFPAFASCRTLNP